MRRDQQTGRQEAEGAGSWAVKSLWSRVLWLAAKSLTGRVKRASADGRAVWTLQKVDERVTREVS